MSCSPTITLSSEPASRASSGPRGVEVVAEAGDGDEAITYARQLRPDLIFMDIKMPQRNGLEVTKAIKAELPEVKVVMLTVSDEDADLFEAIKSGWRATC